ncbi:SIR2 family protein [Frankia sp. AgB1.9]|uniref:SIR2 family NAD-dependent protein deacylase n=1 Tax=unclassified Frankia TaxID=2632575 RepID=UPI0019335DCC|nr:MULTISPECIES: SIR2 family protein [unclassified Frankia]MBL7492422.1 SIR2 family protein [Frankia sp. AgW1.1]MBL7549386.1 SIR2 family protein [Frankia sp. AgB1.9]MBL7624866.1 SIR2 family protein [Frankia sp. AgB1.8]
MDDRAWDRLVTQLRNGECTPFLGADACHPALPTDGDLSAAWANRYGYPFRGSAQELPRVMQYAAVAEGDAVYVKERVKRDLVACGLPDFASAVQPHALLARLPLDVYVTTTYDDFMAKALERAGRHPEVLVCPWDDPRSRAGAFGTAVARPKADRPVVFHLHGSFQEARTMVLTEDDHVEFMTSLSAHRTMIDQLIPTSVIPALKNRPLLFVGYRFDDWTFRVLFRGLLKTLAPVHSRRHISVQLDPSPSGDPALDLRARDYLEKYFDRSDITVFWGSTSEFCIRLLTLLGLT